MKYLGPLLAGGLTLAIVVVVGIFSFIPAAATPAQPAQPVEPSKPAGQIVIAPVDTAEFEAKMAEREAVYQSQLETLNQALQERQTAYQSQIQELTGQVTATQNQLAELKAQEETLPAQITQLEQTRTERQATYQAQLQQFQGQYNDRLTQWQSQLSEV